ncbi:MAG: U32 family peptidase [Ruminococcaceae bacterium]|nr:U32 family peptidase [Oscillospiraceae bacterium]
MKLKAEVLSPVGNTEMLVAAVRSGADAVYLGAEHFNARRNAENFGDAELKTAIEYCHIRGVKVYLTLNIVISDKEMPRAIDTARTAYRYGIDGIICADLGLISLLNQKFPDLPLHASTQLTTLSPAALPVLKKLGICRVVLPREMTAEQIKEFCAAAKKENIETEVFVHGALCMSVSGQCLLSAMLGGRSGNRGLCAGPCRLPFSSNGNPDRYDLSLKDLSLLRHIRELAEYGVSSFKIEGRMKRPEYVAAATAAVRQAVDNGYTDEKLLETLKNVFSRSGFTDGYFTDRKGADMFGTRTIEEIEASKEVFSSIHELYRNERQSIPLDIRLLVKANKNIELYLSDGKNTAVSFAPPPEKAINRAVTKEMLGANLHKFGGTPYYTATTEIDLDDGLSVSAKVINNLRRECVEKLNAMRTNTAEIRELDVLLDSATTKLKKNQKLFARFDSADQIPDDISGLDYISLPLESDISDLCVPDNIIKVVDIPRTFGNTLLKPKLEEFKRRGFTHALCGTLADMETALCLGFKIIGGMGLNVFNDFSAKWLFENGAEMVILSPEMPLRNAVKVGHNTGIAAYGNIPLMLTSNCPIKNTKSCAECGKNCSLTDRKDVTFPVKCRMGMSEILNSRPIWLADRKDELDFDFLMLYFSRETKSEAAKIISAYKSGCTSAPNTEYTRGLYYRKVE